MSQRNCFESHCVYLRCVEPEKSIRFLLLESRTEMNLLFVFVRLTAVFSKPTSNRSQSILSKTWLHGFGLVLIQIPWGNVQTLYRTNTACCRSPSECYCIHIKIVNVSKSPLVSTLESIITLITSVLVNQRCAAISSKFIKFTQGVIISRSYL